MDSQASLLGFSAKPKIIRLNGTQGYSGGFTVHGDSIAENGEEKKKDPKRDEKNLLSG